MRIQNSILWISLMAASTVCAAPSPPEVVLVRIKYTVDAREERYRDDWNAKEFAHVLQNVSALLNEATAARVAPEPRVLELKNDELFSHPFLFMAGHFGVVLSESEVKALRNHLSRGGFLLATACCGNPSFTRTFEREMKKVFPNQALKIIPREHLIYRSLFPLGTIHSLSGADGSRSAIEPAPLSGIEIEGRLAVVFSPLALTCGWANSGRCIESCRRIAPDDACKIAANVVVYCLTH
jgi:hypothetical protein